MTVLLLLLLVVAGVVTLVVRGSRRSGGDGDGGLVSLRRLLHYGFLLAASFTAASGVTRLLQSALPTVAVAGRPAVDVALGLALAVVALPVWALLWRVISRNLYRHPTERAAPAWSLYCAVVTTVTLVVGFVNTARVGRWLVDVGDYQPAAVAYAVVWTVVWALHVWLFRQPRLAPTGRLSELPEAGGALVGLVALAIGTGGILRYGFGQVYRLATGPALIEGATTDALRSSLVVTVLAAAVWWWHWLRREGSRPTDSVWHVFIMLVAVLGGLLTAVTSAAVLLYSILQWLFGNPDAVRAAVHFDSVPGTLAAAVTGAWVWWYHQAVFAHSPARQRGEPDRVYGYLVAAVGLITLASGVAVAIMAALQAVVPGALAAADPGGRNALAAAVTLLLVGTPLWWVFWRRLQALASSDAPEELGSPSRRAYLFLLFGVAGLSAVISLVVILYTVFRDLLEGRLALAVLRDLRTAVGLVIAAGTVSAYHWSVYRQDQEAQPPQRAAHPRTVLLVSSDAVHLAEALTAATGARVRALHRLDVDPAPVDADRVTAAVLAARHPRIIVTVDGGGAVNIIPYDEGG